MFEPKRGWMISWLLAFACAGEDSSIREAGGTDETGGSGTSSAPPDAVSSSSGGAEASAGFEGTSSGTGASGEEESSASGSSPSCLEPGRYEGSVTVDDSSHAFELLIPDSPDGAPAPMVIQLHGGGSTGAEMDFVSRFSTRAEEEGFALLTPEGWAVPPGETQVWNAGSCCGPVAQAPDHVAVLGRMLDRVEEMGACVDPERVFATGHSNGGIMSYRLACELSGRIAAVAVSAGSLANQDLSVEPAEEIFECSPPRPVSILHIHGLQDACVPYEGGETRAGVELPGVESVIEHWRNHNRCDEGTDEQVGPVRRRAFPCAEDTRVELITVEELGHAWAGSPIYGNPETCGGATTQAVSTTEEALRFFRLVR